MIPVRRRSSPFALLGVAAAFLFGAVALSMLHDESIRVDDDEEGGDAEDGLPEVEVPQISGVDDPNVIEGEVVEDEPEQESA